MRQFNRYLVTSALPYANGPLHIGHLAGAYLSADIYVRFQRLMGKDIVYICGSDEHGAAVTIKALKEGKTSQEIVDKYHSLFKKTFHDIGISFDMYHRTSAQIHHETSQEFFRSLHAQGQFIEKTTDQYYDEEAQRFLADRYIIGTCPNCGHEEAYGDQCEKCGSSLSPRELINPRSTISGSKPILKPTTHWFLPLDKYEAWLKEWIEKGEVDGKEYHDPAEWKNHVVGQCKSWLENGLLPRSMTRDLDWGVDVPTEIPGSEGKKLYVWMDAPIGYISATKQWALDQGKDWEPYWKSEDTALIHFIGKDNIVFHCIIFPAILKTEGSYILPVNVPANQFMNLEGKKLSTSKNWAVWVHEYLEDLPGKEDELRYCMIKNMPETRDSEFTWKGYQDSTNNELVNNLANFVNRVLVLTHKYYEGVVPAIDQDQQLAGPDGEMDISFHDSELIRLFDDLQELASGIRTYDFRGGLKTLMEISTKGNQILQFNAPWKLQKEDPEAVKTIMNLSLQYVAAISVACRPFMPFTSDKLRSMLSLSPIKEQGEFDDMLFRLCEGEVLIEEGHKIGEAKHLFTRIEDKVIEEQKEKLVARSASSEANKTAVAVAAESDVKAEVTFDDFTKMDIRTAKITAAEKVPKADKLLQIQLDLGFEQRTVVSGIAEHYTPDEVIGKQVCLLANLAPRKIRGVMSQGMILMAEDDSGKLSFIAPQDSWPAGMKIS